MRDAKLFLFTYRCIKAHEEALRRRPKPAGPPLKFYDERCITGENTQIVPSKSAADEYDKLVDRGEDGLVRIPTPAG